MYQKRHARSLAKDPQAPGSRVASCFQGRNQPDLGRGAVPNRKQSRAGHSASLAVTFFSELSMRLGSRGSGGARRVVRYPCRGGFTGVRAPAALGPLAPWRPLLGSWNVGVLVSTFPDRLRQTLGKSRFWVVVTARATGTVWCWCPRNSGTVAHPWQGCLRPYRGHTAGAQPCGSDTLSSLAPLDRSTAR